MTRARGRKTSQIHLNTSVTEKRILKALDEPAPGGYSRWNGRLLAEHLGNVTEYQVWRVMRKHNLHLERRHPLLAKQQRFMSIQASQKPPTRPKRRLLGRRNFCFSMLRGAIALG